MRYLIVSADDLGLTESINAGIIKAYREGIVTNLNLIPAGEAFEDAVGLMKTLKIEETGAHLSLTETRPVSDPQKIPTLLSKGKKFHKNHNIFFFKFILGLIKDDEIYAELENQLFKIEEAGIKVTNLSSHEHMHIIPRILNIFVRLCKEHNIPAIRYPRRERIGRRIDIDIIMKRIILSCFAKGMKRVLEGSNIKFPEHFIGFLDSGRLKEDTLIDMLSNLGEGITELVSHPGFLSPGVLDRYPWHMNCEYELYALTSRRVKSIIKDKSIKLITYSEFLSQMR